MKFTFTLALFAITLLAALSATNAEAAERPNWQPVDPPMLTRWAKDIDPTMPLPEYPRPQLRRGEWLNLNGMWNYGVVDQGADKPEKWDGKILVPYPIESSLSGVKRSLSPNEVLLYERSVEIPDQWSGRRVMLNFGAVDYRTRVSVNGKSVGEHEGGYLPFQFDITDHLTPSGPQSIVVEVTDPTWTSGQPRGKQTLSPAGIMYTPTSGIWQTVWIEPVAENGIKDLKLVPDVKTKSIQIVARLFGDAEGDVKVHIDGGPAGSGSAGSEITIAMPDARLWTPENPHLYNVRVDVERDGKTIDSVESYFGMRSIKMSNVDGETKLLLNDEPVFMFGPLDQGFWPDGVYTAPTDEALKYDLEITKQFGFNTTRKHIKVEPARWYYHADRIGLLVWQDMPSANSYDVPPSGRPEIDRKAYRAQLAEMIAALRNHPSIVMWVIFNESQGKHDAAELVAMARELDPTRLINEDSGFQDHGGPFLGVGDLYDMHPYPAPHAFDAPDSDAFVLGEYGGIGLKIGETNPWQTEGWGYTTTQDSEGLENLYASYAGMLNEFRKTSGLNAAIYTQLTDIEIEINGLLTYDRQLKVDPTWIAKANRFEWTGPKFESIVATSQEVMQDYRYTLEQPGANWANPEFNAQSWRQGKGGFGSQDTPGIGKLGTAWTSKDIWVRREFDLPPLTQTQLDQLVLHLYHDEDAELYINGVLALKASDFVSGYTPYPISDAAKRALKPGEKNLIAIHCRQTTGGQYIDVGLGTIDPNRSETKQR